MTKMLKNIFKNYSSYRFVEPSFSRGSARVMDLFGNLDDYEYTKADKQTDLQALGRDWEAIGLDITAAIKTYETSELTSKKAVGSRKPGSSSQPQKS